MTRPGRRLGRASELERGGAHVERASCCTRAGACAVSGAADETPVMGVQAGASMSRLVRRAVDARVPACRVERQDQRRQRQDQRRRGRAALIREPSPSELAQVLVEPVGCVGQAGRSGS